MTPLQISYFQNLSLREQLILKTGALLGAFSYESEVNDLIPAKLKTTQREIRKCLSDAAENGLFLSASSRSYSYSDASYKAAPSFLVFIAPQLSGFDDAWNYLSKRYSRYSYYTNIRGFQLLAHFLYCLFHKKDDFPAVQKQYLEIIRQMENPDISELLDYPAYSNVLHKINAGFLSGLINNKLSRLVTTLQPLDEIADFTKRISATVYPDGSDTISMTNDINFHLGKFVDNVYNGVKAVPVFYQEAIRQLIADDAKNAVTFFGKGLRLEREWYRGMQLPGSYTYSMFYFAALLRLSAEDAALQCSKILTGLNKKSYSPFDDYLKTIIYNTLNNREKKDAHASLIFQYLQNGYTDLGSLVLISVLFLADAKPEKRLLPLLLKTVQKAADSGYYTLAHEAAYALKTWFSAPEIDAIFDEVHQKLSFQPLVSQIERHEAWEKSLNLLLAFAGARQAKSAKDKQESSRVIYLLNPLKGEIQPILQTRNAKGVWSAGRNIALKTFSAGKTPGMTEQDLRVSKSVNQYGDYYSAYFDFSERAMVDLVGHPYLFLAGGKEIPIELVAAQPEIKVTKTGKGYALQSDIKEADKSVFVIKETNTRYKVYDLAPTQIELVKLLKEQSIIIPEQGRTRLGEALGVISRFATIHSDLLADDSGNVKMKKVTADNRIRVQLLPFGDGLKAELFSKPFGSHPPYCKPGVGGKTLIANEKGVQLRTERNLKTEKMSAETLLNNIQTLENVNTSADLIAFDNPLDSLNLLDVVERHKNICVVEWPEGERFKLRAHADIDRLSINIKSKTNWFELTGELKIDEKTVLSIQQLLAMMPKSHDRFIELGHGEFIALGNELKKRLEELYTFANNDKDGVKINKFASLAMGDFLDNAQNLKADKAWKEFRNRVRLQETVQEKIPPTLKAELRPYQEDGFRWMAHLAEWEGGACLADDMGLGKTVQALAVLLHRITVGAALVVCPVSVLGNWAVEIKRFAPTLNIKTLANGNRIETMQSLEAGDVLITSYGLLQSEEKLFSQTPFATAILDEAHVIKNFATKTSKAIMQLQASFRVALTGTPLQNHLGELWNLFNFINPGLLGSMQHFNDTYVKTDNEFVRKHLKKLISPFILRRTKSAVLDELPPKTEILKKVQLSPQETAFYEALRRTAILNLEASDANQGAKHLQALAEITKLRQASCHPALVNAELDLPSSKLNVFLEIVDELVENNHRALVFSQFVSHLSIVRRALDEKGVTYQYLDGSTPIAERERSVKKFQNGEGLLFLISLKAGGLGLNLTAADYVIHMDPWWNPAIEDQASDRAHRIGQTRPVTIYRLIAENTIEEKILQLHHSKRNLAESLLEGSDQSARLSLNELISLIKEGE